MCIKDEPPACPNTDRAFVALPQIPPRNVNWSGRGYWVHAAKVVFEKYFLRKVRSGTSAPIYERAIMKILGIDKLRRDARTPKQAA